jgi:uncharacterized protein (TIGR00255 family)
MLRSMTAYGRAETVKGNIAFVAEIKSVNSRYREIILRLPQVLQPLEDRIKPMISSALKRGRIEISIQMKDNSGNNLELQLNKPLVKAYITVLNELNRELGCDQPIDLSAFSQLKDTIIMKQENVDIEKMWPDLREVIDKALLSLDAMRLNEGKVIEKDFLKRLKNIKHYIKEISDQSKVTIEGYRDKLIEKIQKLVKDLEIAEDRLVQEVAVMAERSDITEELVRTRSHLEQFRNYMNEDDAIGRRLEFLLQEINREVNTIGSKAADSLISQRAVEIKAELERLREQIQNVE